MKTIKNSRLWTEEEDDKIMCCAGPEAIPQSSPKPMNSVEMLSFGLLMLRHSINTSTLSFQQLCHSTSSCRSWLFLDTNPISNKMLSLHVLCMVLIYMFFFQIFFFFFLWIVLNICITKECNVLSTKCFLSWITKRKQNIEKRFQSN